MPALRVPAAKSMCGGDPLPRPTTSELWARVNATVEP